MAKIERGNMIQTDAKGKVTREAKNDKDTAELTKFYWWKADEDVMAQEIASTVAFIQKHQQISHQITEHKLGTDKNPRTSSGYNNPIYRFILFIHYGQGATCWEYPLSNS